MIWKKVNDTTIDVFTGHGWYNWSRFTVKFENKRLSLQLIKGKPMSKEEFRQLYFEVAGT